MAPTPLRGGPFGGRRAIRGGAGAALGLALTGCSFVFRDPPPRPYEPDRPCASTRLFPIADAVYAGLFGIAVVDYLVVAVPQGDGTDPFLWPGALASAAISALLGVSAAAGFESAAACRAYEAARESREGAEAQRPDTSGF